MSIFLVRHAETPWNAARIVQLPEIALSERGLAQAERLAARLAALGIARILSSDLTRARMTADRIQASTGAPLESEPLLRERDFGDIRGTPYADLAVDIFGPDFVPPRGESWARFHVRVDLAWEQVTRVASATAGNLVVVTHGLVCRSLAERRLERGGAAPPLAWANTSLTEIDATPPWRVRRMNCTAHLEGAADDPSEPPGPV